MKKVASKYAVAVFELAQEQKLEEQFYREMHQIDAILTTHPEIIQLLNKTQFTKQQKKDLIKDIFGKVVHPFLLNTFYLLVDKNRSLIIPHLTKEYRHIHNQSFKILEAIAYSVSPLSDKELSELEENLSNREKQRVSLVNRIDPTLISGIKIRFEDKVIDGSMKARIENMRAVLREGRS